MRIFTFSALLCLLHFILPGIAAAQGCNIIAVTTPAGSPAATGFAEKFELAIQLDKAFTGGRTSHNNPYDPRDISVEATFISPSNRVEPTVYGFYYQDFTIDNSKIASNSANYSLYWQPLTTNFPWRVRFAPNELGTWTYSLSVTHQGVTNTYYGTLPALTCVPSTNPNNKGFLKVAPNKRNLMFENGTSFFAIGSNVDYWGQDLKGVAPVPTNDSCVVNGKTVLMNKLPQNDYYRKFSPYMLYGHTQVFDDMKKTGANFARIWMHYFGWDFEVNDDDLGYYQAHQNRMYDFDRLLESANANDIYIHLTMLDGARLWDQPDTVGSNQLWRTFPYNTVLNPAASTVANPQPYDYVDIPAPYSNAGDPRGPAFFYINRDAKQFYKNKIRYIVSRWGYSRNICSYELINEGDFADGGRAVNQHYGADLSNKLYPWTDTMATYLRTLDKRHLHTLAYGPEEADWFVDNHRGLVDYTVSHFYSSLATAEMQKSYLTLLQTTRHDMPYQMQEWDYALGYNPLEYNSKFHSTNWATSFNGSFGIALPLSAHANLYAPCWPAAAEFLPLAAFLGKYFSSALTNKPIGNATAAASVMYPAAGNSTTYLLEAPVAPYATPCYTNAPGWKGSYGISPGYWGGGPGAVPPVSSNPIYLTQGIFLTNASGTNDNGMVEVYALQNEARITGWAHNKTHYWYNQPTDATSTANLPQCAQNSPYTITPFSGEKMHITNLSCQGEYTIRWFYTHVDKDPDGKSKNGPDGGFIPLRYLFPNLVSSGILTSNDTTTVGSTSLGIISNNNGELIIDVPALTALGGPGFEAPDYAFVISTVKGANYASNASQWRHDIPAFPQSQAQALGSNYALTADGKEIFYQGDDGNLHHLHYETAGQTWVNQDSFSLLIAAATANGEDVSVQAGGKIMVNSGPLTQNNLSVYYKGGDGTIQYYSYNGTWSHSYVTDYNSAPNYALAGDMVWSNPFGYEQIIYRGADGYLQRYYSSNSTWVHDYLAIGNLSPSWKVASRSQILVDASGLGIFYTGANSRMHHYSWGNGGTNWSHSETDYWVSTPNNSHYVQGNFAVSKNPATGEDQVVYRGQDGFVHRLYWVASPTYKWTHEVVGATSGGTMPGDAAMMPDSRIVLNANGSRIYYRGAYNDMQHFVWYGSYAHNHTDWATGAPSSAHNVRQGGDLVATSVNGVEQVFYTGDDGYVQRFYEATNGVKHDWVVATTTPSSPISAVQGTTQLLANAEATSLFYAGQDNAVHRYHFSCTTANQRTTAAYSPVLATAKPTTVPTFVCYPNPAHHNLTIEFRTKQQFVSVKAQLCNIMGQQVRELVKSQQVDAGTTKLSIENLDIAPGIYYVLFFENGVLTHKQNIAIE